MKCHLARRGLTVLALSMTLMACGRQGTDPRNDQAKSESTLTPPEPAKNPGAAPVDAIHKNLQVLPAAISKPELKARMKRQAKALGLTCDDCHDTDDFSADTNEHKVVARQMMKMVDRLNQEFFPEEKEPIVGCYTCHQGQEKPAQEK